MSRTLLALGSLLPAQMAELERHFDIIRLWKEADPEGTIRSRSRDIVAVLAYPGKVSRELIEALPNLEIIATFSVGTDHIDLQAAAEHQVAVAHTPDVLSEEVADTAMALTLCVARRIVEADIYVRVGKWKSGDMPLGSSVSGKTMGIVGFGRIGQAIARRAQAFNMGIVYHGRNEQPDQPYGFYADLEAMARASDFLMLACPGCPETQGLVNMKILEALGPKGYLINIARGYVVEESDLLAALHDRKIAGAGLDVFWKEPDVPEGLISMDNVVLLPHIGSATFETRTKMGQLVVNNLLAYFEGKPLLTPVTA